MHYNSCTDMGWSYTRVTCAVFCFAVLRVSPRYNCAVFCITVLEKPELRMCFVLLCVLCVIVCYTCAACVLFFYTCAVCVFFCCMPCVCFILLHLCCVRFVLLHMCCVRFVLLRALSIWKLGLHSCSSPHATPSCVVSGILLAWDVVQMWSEPYVEVCVSQ